MSTREESTGEVTQRRAPEVSAPAASAPPSAPHGYWYDDDTAVVNLLTAVRRFRRADQEMRRRVSTGMDMNETDMQALQAVVEAEGRGGVLTPRELAAHLGISSASTTKLLDRLTASGHLSRAPHPSDRRSLVLVATPHAHDEIRERLTLMHERMAEIARAVPVGSRGAVVDFLEAMTAELDGHDVTLDADHDVTPGADVGRSPQAAHRRSRAASRPPG